MALILSTFLFLFLVLPFSEQCAKHQKPPDNSVLIAEQRKGREQELRLWCHEHCVSQWSPWSLCDSRCGRGKIRRSRVNANSDWCKVLRNFRCTQSLTQEGDCNAGCPFGGLPSNRACIGCPKSRKGDCCQTEIFCPNLRHPQNGDISGPWPAPPDSRAKFTCNTGFNLVGDNQATCTVTGTWNRQPPKCEVIQCAQPITNPNVIVLNAKSTGYAFGESVFYDCEDGYTMQGERSRECKRSITGKGTWTGYDVLCEAVKCPVPVIPRNGRIATESTSFQYGDIVRFSCNPGYKLVGSDALECLASGSWFGHEPTCQAIVCDAPFTPRHGQVRIRTAGIRSLALFECDEGYTLEPNVPLLICSSEGTWNGTEPSCRVSSCGDPGTPINGYREGGVFTFGEKVTFHCERGYEIKGGSKTMECQSNRQWSGSLPTCEACPIGFFMDDEMCNKCPANSLTATEASTSVVQCQCDEEKGFVGPPGGPCEEVFCTELTAPDHGGISECGNKVDDSCKFTCEDGFVLERGSTQRTCHNTGEWDGTQPFCIPCKLNTYKSGERTCSPCPLHAHTEEPGQMLTGCVCDEGYGGPPGGPCTDVNECATNNDKGPCSDTCENNDGGYRCRCSIPGYKIDPQNDLSCVPEEQCRNLTRDDAPENGGLICHWYHRQNAQHCTKKCSSGFDLATRSNNFEFCGPSTQYEWSYQLVNKNAILPPCIVPCPAGSYHSEEELTCIVCPVNFYQNKDKQNECIPCKSQGPGYFTAGNGSNVCQICSEGYWGEDCVKECSCAHGSCSPFTGECICPSGWEGTRCEKDANSCVDGSCYPGVTCIDKPPHGTGFSCGPCPIGYDGDGIDCVQIGLKRSIGLLALET